MLFLLSLLLGPWSREGSRGLLRKAVCFLFGSSLYLLLDTSPTGSCLAVVLSGNNSTRDTPRTPFLEALNHCAMANRQITRRVVVSAVIALFIVFVLFYQPKGPLSPAVRAPGHIDKSAPASKIPKDDLLKGEVVMPRLGNETVK